MNTRIIACAILLGLVTVTGCRDRAADEAARIAAQAAVNEKAAKENADGFDAAVASENWSLAKAQADVLFARYPDTEAARTATLWSYQAENVKGGQQLSAAIYSKDGVDTDGSGAKTVRLIFRDHPSWGKSSYLVLQAGDFACYGGCTVKVQVDDGTPKPMAALRPDTDDAIAMFINDERALWRMARKAKTIAVEFPVKAGGKRTAVFEVAGLDGAKLPGWD